MLLIRFWLKSTLNIRWLLTKKSSWSDFIRLLLMLILESLGNLSVNQMMSFVIHRKWHLRQRAKWISEQKVEFTRTKPTNLLAITSTSLKVLVYFSWSLNRRSSRRYNYQSIRSNNVFLSLFFFCLNTKHVDKIWTEELIIKIHFEKPMISRTCPHKQIMIRCNARLSCSWTINNDVRTKRILRSFMLVCKNRINENFGSIWSWHRPN